MFSNLSAQRLNELYDGNNYILKVTSTYKKKQMQESTSVFLITKCLLKLSYLTVFILSDNQHKKIIEKTAQLSVRKIKPFKAHTCTRR